MPTKKVTRKKKEGAGEAAKSSKYFAGIGRRKQSVARVKVVEAGGENSAIIVNKKELKEYLPLPELSGIASSPLDVVGESKNFSVTVKVSGGGIRGQAEAIRLGLARALVLFNDQFKKPLRDLKYLTRDDRVVERKKPGLTKGG